MKFRSSRGKSAWERLCFASMHRAAPLALAAAVSFALPAIAQQQPASSLPAQAAPVVPSGAQQASQALNLDPKTVLMLVRSTLIALDQANKTGNYSVLRDLGSPDFQRMNSDAKLAEAFAGQRSTGLDLAAALVLEPTMTFAPQADKNGLLRLAGFFPVNGDMKLNFEILFQGYDRRLLLAGLSVNVAQAGATSGTGGPSAAQVPIPGPAPAAVAPPTPAAGAEVKTEAKPKPKPKPRPKPKPKPESEPAPIQ